MPSKPSTPLLWSEPGQEREGWVARVAPVAPIHETYSFVVPEALRERVKPGVRVTVRLGRAGRLTQGFVTDVTLQVWTTSLRPIESVLDDHAALTPELIELGRRVAEHYACAPGLTYKAMLPEVVRQGAGLKRVRHVRLIQSWDDIRRSKTRIGAKRRAVIKSLLDASDPPGQRAFETLKDDLGVSEALLRAMVKDGWIEVVARKESAPTEEPIRSSAQPDFILNDEQRQAYEVILEKIRQDAFAVVLMHGVSGSGKTEVYIHAMRHVLAQGRQAILLVPEIVLTTQLVERLAARFTDVAVLHSGLTGAQRADTWRRVAGGEKNVVIGTRSAVFAPCPKLGLICVDEEQERSYKNLRTPRFHVRDVAIMRGHQLGVPVVLGSATPSLESWLNSEFRPHYHRVTLRKRVGDRPLPDVRIIDMEMENQAVGQEVVVSRWLRERLRDVLDRGEQAMILLNRRGFATRLYCPRCRQSLKCPRCNVQLVAHEVRGQAICHHCCNRIPTPTHCPMVTCGERLARRGVGSERATEVIHKLFPEARLRRVDSDAMSHRRLYREVVTEFEARKIDVLIGTQMIAKGLDFPMVSLVGVLNAEGISAVPDFRNQESVFQLITQVAGRAGRADVSGEVLVQTTLPDLAALTFAKRHDYEGFARQELAMRRRLGYPPYKRLARLILTHEREKTLEEEAERLAAALRDAIKEMNVEGADIVGPAPCPRARLRDRYRYDLLLRADKASDRQTLLTRFRERRLLKTTARSLTLDVDPVSMD